ncbi:TmcC family electron transfer complex membrane anchor subunit [Halodesulfovibrio sp.]|jgi:nitrate reductase gamma subunit|uniref:TmcC family electron transfer complex membrane anchor subunit n=1 Tax=Halodesulfovibrio sp. TaxID=1912772 RepID=UPI0025E94C24|nr:nitrate reductase [Halodesulfovibrio sp.]MCT4534108.1 respiratory nitrate reductase subunit gamma [Halodesulfovibrio sp.]
MNSLYNFAVGPLAWAAFIILAVTAVWRLWSMYVLATQKDASSIAYMNWRFSLRSIFNWLIPYKSLGWKTNPILTAVTFVFHVSFVVLVIFVTPHQILLENTFGITYPTLSPQSAEVLTLIVIACCCYFAYRRLTNVTVRYVTRSNDWISLGLVAAPFITALLGSWGLGGEIMPVLHVLTALALIVAIPFTRLSHILFALFTRAYIGSEFGGVRHCKDW